VPTCVHFDQQDGRLRLTTVKSTVPSRHQIIYIYIYNSDYKTVTSVNYYNLGFKIQSHYSKVHAQPEFISHFQAIHGFLTHADYLILLQ